MSKATFAVVKLIQNQRNWERTSKQYIQGISTEKKKFFPDDNSKSKAYSHNLAFLLLLFFKNKFNIIDQNWWVGSLYAVSAYPVVSETPWNPFCTRDS